MVVEEASPEFSLQSVKILCPMTRPDHEDHLYVYQKVLCEDLHVVWEH